MARIAVFPGSFDPITLGHSDIIMRGAQLFEKIFVGIGNNAEKKYMFSLQQRETWVRETFRDFTNIDVACYSGLTVDFCKKVNARFILRGLRTGADFEFEKAIAHMNNAVNKDIETIFLLSDLKYAALSSSIVRDIKRNGGNVGQFVPDPVDI